jgi:hypothetical protein
MRPRRPSVSEAGSAYRWRVAQAVVAALQDDPAVRAIGEGGAVARGRADEYSDLDLMIVAPLAQAESIFSKIESAIGTIAAITHRWVVEPVSYPEMAQRFYFMADAPRYFAVDCSVLSATGIDTFLERERHGEAVVWFDRDGVLKTRALDAEALARRRAHRVQQLQGAVPVYSMLVEKELARGHMLEALGFYQVLVRALIELLGIRHRPDRFDYGWRYVERELPGAAQALIAQHAFVSSGAALEKLKASLVSVIQTLLNELACASEVRPVDAISAPAPVGRPSP